MSTWDDKPNDYEHAAAQLVQCQLQLENAGYTLEKQWQDIMVLKDEVLQAKAEARQAGCYRPLARRAVRD